MIDQQLRATKDRIVEPVVRRLPSAVTPGRLTLVSLLGGAAAGLLAASGWHWWALAAWLVSRLCDGLDGAVARRSDRQSDLGGYLDLMADAVGYIAVPLGVAAAQDERSSWVACAVLLASFYVNVMSWALLSAIAATRAVATDGRESLTTVHMPMGLVEGAETIVLFAVMLAWPGSAQVVCWVMAALVVVTVVQRLVWAARTLR